MREAVAMVAFMPASAEVKNGSGKKIRAALCRAGRTADRR